MPANGTNGKEYKLMIRIAGAIDKTFNTSLATSETALKKAVGKINADFTRLDKVYNSVSKTGVAALGALAKASGVAALAIGAAAASAIKAGSSFESAFAGVKKTVYATDQEYNKLRKDIIALTREIPSTADEIAQTMEIAGQLGIANDSLVPFTKTMINLGVATKMTSEDAATYLARLANITSMSDYDELGVSNWDRLGSALIYLGNNFATTEEEISAMATKLASTASIVGLSEAEILGLSTAMSSVGIKADAGGSAMSKLLKKIQLAVETNSKSLKQYAKVADMTTDEFSTAFKDNAVSALTAFIGGLNDTERNGKTAVAVLADMGLNEVRLSNMILALTGATELMNDAIDKSNSAWESADRLTEAAGKRYETLESQFNLMKNAFKELGITAYEEMRGPAVDAVQTITDKVNSFTDTLRGPNGISAWIDKVGTGIPTALRKAQKAGKSLLNFLSPLLSIAKWFVKNPNAIVSTIVGIGAALTSYKIASGLVHATNAIIGFLSAASPLTWAVVGVTTAIGAVAAAYTNYKVKEQMLIDNSLASHFGSITLSMQELQEVAKGIIKGETFDDIQKATDVFNNVEELSKSIENSVRNLDRYNWKVAVGLDLTDKDKNAYINEIENFIEYAQEYVEQAGYGVSIINGVSFGDDADITSKINQFYTDKATELANLGNDLRDAVTNAFNDGLLEIQELEVITNLQNQMAEIKKSLAIGDFEAGLSVIGMKYGGTALTSDTFQNLQAEVGEQVASAMTAYEEAYVKSYAAATASHEAGYLSDSEYAKAIENAQNVLYSEKAALMARAVQFQAESITGAYGGDYAAAVDRVINSYENNPIYTDNAWANNGDRLWSDALRYITTSNSITDKKAINSLVGNMSDTISEFNAFTAANWNLLNPETQALVNNANAALDTAKAAGTYYGLFDNIKGDKTAVENDVKRRILGSGSGRMYNWLTNIKGHANGGLVVNRQLSWLGERGPEMVVPLDGSRNAVSLWEKAGKLLNLKGKFDGVDLGTGSSSPAITYSPTLQFYGGAPNRDDLTDALRISQDEFDAMMEGYFKRQRRVAF